MMQVDTTAVNPPREDLRKYGEAVLRAKSMRSPYQFERTPTPADINNINYIDSNLIDWLSAGNENNQILMYTVLSKIANYKGASSAINCFEIVQIDNINEAYVLIAQIRSGVSLIPSESIRTLAKSVVRTTDATPKEIMNWAETLASDTGSSKD